MGQIPPSRPGVPGFDRWDKWSWVVLIGGLSALAVVVALMCLGVF